MINMENTNWQINDIAICIKTGYVKGNKEGAYFPPLRLNNQYIVQNIFQCPICKETALDVGFNSNSKKGTLCGCGEHMTGRDIHWCCSTRFVKKQTLSKEEELKEALANENYEKAAELTKQV